MPSRPSARPHRAAPTSSSVDRTATGSRARSRKQRDLGEHPERPQGADGDAAEAGRLPVEGGETVIDRVAGLDQARRGGNREKAGSRHSSLAESAEPGGGAGPLGPSGASAQAAPIVRPSAATISQIRSRAAMTSSRNAGAELADDERSRAP